MKLYISTVLILVLAFGVVGQDKDVVVTAKQANIRESPSAQSKVVRTVKRGELLTVSKSEGNWYYTTFDKSKGWIHYTTIRKATDKDLPDLSKYEIKSENKNSKADDLDEYLNGWSFVANSDTGRIYYNASKTTQIGVAKMAWTKTISAKPADFFDYFIGDISTVQRKDFAEKLTTTKVNYFLQRLEVICKLRFMKTESYYIAWADGSTEEVFLFKGHKAPALPVVPDTVDDVILSKVCS